jgi:hypothetical protein
MTRYRSILAELEAVAESKSHDYGRETDPYANVRASEDFGVPAWCGVLMRANDKMCRLQVAASGKALANEGVEESLLDLAGYAIIALDLFRGLASGRSSNDRTTTNFSDIIVELQSMHDGKSQDYGRETDPYANVRASENFGIAPWVGTMIRANDKMRRLQAAARGSTLSDEGIEDSLLDLAVYVIIALDLFRDSLEVSTAEDVNKGEKS